MQSWMANEIRNAVFMLLKELQTEEWLESIVWKKDKRWAVVNWENGFILSSKPGTMIDVANSNCIVILNIFCQTFSVFMDLYEQSLLFCSCKSLANESVSPTPNSIYIAFLINSAVSVRIEPITGTKRISFSGFKARKYFIIIKFNLRNGF